VPISVRFAGDGTPLAKPCPSASFRVFIEGGLEAGYAISAEGLRIIRDDLEARRRFIACATSFCAWLDDWRYVAEGGFPRTLAASIWEGQEQALEAMLAHPFLFALKGRQVGLTTLACAYDAWHVRFGPPNATAHLFSKGEADAPELLEQVVYGLDNLPVFLGLPSTRSTVRIRRYDAGPHDTRTLRAFPADRTTGRGHTCTHAHIDEWSAMQWPARTLASILPSVAEAIGSCHILTTECVGPESESAGYYRRCEAGEGTHVPLFVSSLARADRDEAWLEGQRRSMHPDAFNREFPTTAEQALEAAGERYFEATDVELADVDANGLGPARTYLDRRGRERPFRYAVGVDVGFRQDATAIVVLELTDEGHDVVDYRYLTGASPAEVQRQIEHVATRYPNCLILVEDNGPGYVVRHNLDLADERVQGFTTGELSKERILDNLYAELRAQTIKWPHDDCPELTREMYACRAGRHTGDTVISLALALEAARFVRERAPGTWSVLRV
jgi:hypothetical protein